MIPSKGWQESFTQATVFVLLAHRGSRSTSARQNDKYEWSPQNGTLVLQYTDTHMAALKEPLLPI